MSISAMANLLPVQKGKGAEAGSDKENIDLFDIAGSHVDCSYAVVLLMEKSKSVKDLS